MIFERTQLQSSALGDVTPELWTVVIPAAGRGSRLGYDHPKVLFPIMGKPMIVRMLELFQPFCARSVVVVSPAGRSEIQMATRDLGPELVLQPEPLGMAHAIQQAEKQVKTPMTVVVWGDQVTLRPETLKLAMLAHEKRPSAKLTLPTVIQDEPYIQFVRDAHGKLLRVLQRREGEISDPQGETDCGLFLFDTERLFQVLAAGRQSQLAMGKSTGEFNLLPLLPLFEAGPASVATVRVAEPEETLGVNTPEDALRAERILSERGRREA